MPRRSKAAAGGQGIALFAERGLGRRRLGVHDLRVERRRAVRSVGVRVGAAQPVVDVHRPHVVAEPAERVPEAGRVGAARDETRQGATGLDQPVRADVLLDPLAQLHARMVPIDHLARQIGERRRRRPRAKRRRRQPHRIRVERERLGVRDRRDARGRERPVGGVDDVPDRKCVGDGEDDVLGPVEQCVERTGHPQRRLGPAFAVAGALRIRRVRPGPRPIVRERPALERAEADLAQRRQHHALDLPLAEREVERLLGPHQRGRHAEVDLLGGERCPKLERLGGALLRQPLAGRHGADVVAQVRARVAVADEQQAPQNSTLR